MPTSRDHSVYAISVVAGLVGTGTQNLRAYERRGLLDPGRTDGGTRRYSQNDVDRARQIVEMLADGHNLMGVARILELESENADFRRQLKRRKS